MNRFDNIYNKLFECIYLQQGEIGDEIGAVFFPVENASLKHSVEYFGDGLAAAANYGGKLSRGQAWIDGGSFLATDAVMTGFLQ